MTVEGNKGEPRSLALQLDRLNQKQQVPVRPILGFVCVLVLCVSFILSFEFSFLKAGGFASALSSTESKPMIRELNSTKNEKNGNPLDDYNLTPLAKEQVRNYREGRGLILNVHVTHHAGTTFCRRFGRAPDTDGAPSFACMHPQDDDRIDWKEYPIVDPWRYNETSRNIDIVRKYFHMIAWEFGNPRKEIRLLADTNWEDPKLVSVFVTRDPMSRLLAGRGPLKIIEGQPDAEEYNKTLTEEEWWKYTKHRATDNYQLRVLAENDCCQGASTDRKHLENAKALMKRFTFILDIACLNDSMQALAGILGIQLQMKGFNKNKTKLPVEDRIPYKNVYEFLKEQNKLDMELYEWARGRALIRCPISKS